MLMRGYWYSIFICFALLLSGIATANSNVQVSVKNAANKPLANAVVSVLPLDTASKLAAQKRGRAKTGVIHQRNKIFLPHVSVFQKGTAINFLNHDPIKHHVYSFSPAKKFELKLYSGKPQKQIKFDKPGLVTLGCNIHDKMLAYSYIVDTPYYALTNNSGRAVVKGLPAGSYRLEVVHPRQKSSRSLQRNLKLPAKQNLHDFKIALKPQWKRFRKPRKSSFDDEDDDPNY